MNKESNFINILNDSLPLCKQKLRFGENFYKAYNVRSWLLFKCPHVMDRPAQSTDTSPILISKNYKN